jgi:hypothetical protein
MTTDALPAISLPDLAERINVEHAACLTAAQDAVGRAIEVGRLLVEAKGQVKHGEWTPWIEKHCPFGDREAQHYMKVYKGRHQIRNGVSDLTSLRGAIAVLAEPKPESDRLKAMASKIKSIASEANRLHREAVAGKREFRQKAAETDELTEEFRVSGKWKDLGYESWEACVEGQGWDELGRMEQILSSLIEDDQPEGTSGADELSPVDPVSEKSRTTPNPVWSSDLLSGNMWVSPTDRAGLISLGLRAGASVTEAVLNLDAAKELRRMLDEAIAHESGAN